ncbi:membrane or secreted protein [Tellurirhabdus bombi]|uniref:membrane or secreted protein n=1 Tax=Tellurirhabdus bombi TaxID=2907205 RepID=UPI001F19C403|nr:membrane or secreted protein [Tellurirhabdus bombi]
MMKLRLLLLSLILVTAFYGFSPPKVALKGAWRQTDAKLGPNVVIIASDGYLMQTTYAPDRYVSTRGGAYQQDDKLLKLAVEFDTEDSTRVGQPETYEIGFTNQRLVLLGPGGRRVFERIDDAAPSAQMAGLWRMAGNIADDGQIKTRPRTARKTLKLLTGTRFQWATINPETKQFSGTGGGTYTYKNGKYTETIDFFSRDNSRVGRSLQFDAELKENNWLHRGQSSTGGKVSEVWTRE